MYLCALLLVQMFFKDKIVTSKKSVQFLQFGTKYCCLSVYTWQSQVNTESINLAVWCGNPEIAQKR